ncbi:MAG: hypothetical protein LBT13_01275 [Treponema sp.]|jgi:hypothetical protein|nr:hypothetical protein [Treponema sp.]
MISQMLHDEASQDVAYEGWKTGAKGKVEGHARRSGGMQLEIIHIAILKGTWGRKKGTPCRKHHQDETDGPCGSDLAVIAGVPNTDGGYRFQKGHGGPEAQ